jgi:hypothetical protein
LTSHGAGKVLRRIGRVSRYAWQRATHTGFDRALEASLSARAQRYLVDTASSEERRSVPSVSLHDLTLDPPRFTLLEKDRHLRFRVGEDGEAVDRFGRRGHWETRGGLLFLDAETSSHLKLFDETSATHGEPRFLRQAIDAGMYDLLCPGLRYVVQDRSGVLRGYAVQTGRPTSRYEFERYIGALREVVIDATRRTGLYFTDLVPHNTIIHDDQLSLIDLESVLPIAWFGTDMDFARAHLHEVDIGWVLASKFNAPAWYRRAVSELSAEVRPEIGDPGRG